MLGIATAVVLGYLLYRRAVTINLAKFFTWTGAGLIVVAAGVLAYGVHDLQEAGILPGLNNLAFDVSGAVPPDSWYGTLLKGIVNFSPATTWLQAVVWLLYLVPVMYLFFRPGPTAGGAGPGVVTGLLRAGTDRAGAHRKPLTLRTSTSLPTDHHVLVLPELPHALVPAPACPGAARHRAARRPSLAACGGGLVRPVGGGHRR